MCLRGWASILNHADCPFRAGKIAREREEREKRAASELWKMEVTAHFIQHPSMSLLLKCLSGAISVRVRRTTAGAGHPHSILALIYSYERFDVDLVSALAFMIRFRNPDLPALMLLSLSLSVSHVTFDGLETTFCSLISLIRSRLQSQSAGKKGSRSSAARKPFKGRLHIAQTPEDRPWRMRSVKMMKNISVKTREENKVMQEGP